MENFGSKYRLEISLAVVFLVLLPLFVFAMRAMIADIDEKAGTVKTKNIDQEINDGFLNDIVNVREQKKIVDAGVEELQVLLSDEEGAKIMLFAELERLAKEAGNSEVNISIQKQLDQNRPKTKGEAVKEVVVEPAVNEMLLLDVQTLGTYQNFLAFLHKIENITYFSDVMNITLKAVEQKSQSQFQQLNNRENVEEVRENEVEGTIIVAVYLESALENNIAAKNAQKAEISEIAGSVGVVVEESVINPNEQ